VRFFQSNLGFRPGVLGPLMIPSRCLRSSSSRSLHIPSARSVRAFKACLKLRVGL